MPETAMEWWTVIGTLGTIASVLVAMGFFKRKEKALKDLLYADQQLGLERIKTANLKGRLMQVDPERFIEQADALAKKGDYEALEKLAFAFTDRQTEAFGRAAEILAEQRILDSEEKGAEAVAEAQRFVAIGLAANPANIRLIELKKLADARAQGIARGEPIEALNWDGLSATEMSNLAEHLAKDGKYALAEVAARRAVPMVAAAHGDSGAKFARAVWSHGRILRMFGVYGEAENLLRQALVLQEKAKDGGKNNIYYGYLNSLAVAISKAGNKVGAIELFEQIKVYSHSTRYDPKSLYAMAISGIGTILSYQGKHDAAEPLMREALEIVGKTLGQDHQSFATYQDNLASLLQDTGLKQEAEPMFRAALEIRRKTLGEGHPDYARSLHNLATLLKDSGRYDEAVPMYGVVLEIRRKTLGEWHPDYASSLNSLATLKSATSRQQAAIGLYNQSLAINTKSLGPDHAETKRVAENLAVALTSKN